MSRRDEQIIEERSLGATVVALGNLTVQIKEAKREQRRLIKLLRKCGLSSRFLGRVSDMSPQTILNIAKDRP